MKVSVNVQLTPRELAEFFCSMDDEKQAQFFIEAASIAAKWETNEQGLGADWQWYSVGRHLRTCSCSTEEARDLVKSIADAAAATY